MKKWLVFCDSDIGSREVVIIPPASSHPAMQVGLMIEGVRVWLRRETARELADELKRQAGSR